MKAAMVSEYPPRKKAGNEPSGSGPPDEVHQYHSRLAKTGAHSHGMARYTRRLLERDPKDVERIVIADKDEGEKVYQDEVGTIYRTWIPGTLYPLTIASAVMKSGPDIVHIQHEVFMYGEGYRAALFPLLVAMIKVMGKRVVITTHNGIIPLDILNDGFLADNGIKGGRVLRSGLVLLMKWLSIFSNGLIVHEEKLRRILVEQYHCPSDKVFVIHHGIDAVNPSMGQDEAKEALGLSGKKVILFLGYIAGYKNLDLLIDSASYIKTDDWTMLIAGGEHPRLSDDPEYRAMVDRIKKKAMDVPEGRVRLVGFIPEEELEKFVMASDVMVLPYRLCMSASGPLAIAMAYRRPALVSRAFEGIVNGNEMMFEDDPRDLAAKIDKVLGGSGEAGDTTAIRESRTWQHVSDETWSLYRKVMP